LVRVLERRHLPRPAVHSRAGLRPQHLPPLLLLLGLTGYAHCTPPPIFWTHDSRAAC
jgi:hypothetical protein